MPSVFERLLASGFSELSGLGISGTVPLKQELINELLAELLTAAPPVANRAASRTAPDPKAFLALVKKLEVAAAPGVVTITFELKA